VILQPGDSFDTFALPYMEAHGLDHPPQVFGARVSLDDDFGWTAEIDVEDGGLIEAHDFERREDIMMFLTQELELELGQISEE
jgi:hypothetical protein